MILKSQRCARFNRFYSKAEDIIEAVRAEIEAERLRKQKENATNQHLQPKKEGCGEQIPHKLPERTSAKVAEMFNTNEKYIKEASRIKRTYPEKYKEIQSGKKTITEVKKEEKEAIGKRTLIRKRG
jgi:hypothetical protein